MDFRVNDKNEIFFLEVNFTCSVFFSDGYEGSADYILKFDGVGQSGFLQHIINEGIYRCKSQLKKYTMKGDSINGLVFMRINRSPPKKSYLTTKPGVIVSSTNDM
jgi:D-alanine-D-alanine ligase